METVVPPPVDDELHLLTEWANPADDLRTRRAAIASVLLHIALIFTLALMPADVREPPPSPPVHRRVTPLVEPLTELTQKAPNTGKVTKEFNAAEVTPQRRIQTPASPPRPRATRPSPPPAAVARQAPP